MTIKVFHLNIYTGKYLDNIISYLNQNDFDIIQIQESATQSFGYAQKDIFREIKKTKGYEGFYLPTLGLLNQKNKTTGCATFFKPDLNLVSKDFVWLRPYTQIETIEQFLTADPPDVIENQGRAAISLQFDFGNIKINFVNTHLVWSQKANDTQKKLDAGKQLFDYVRNLKNDFVLTGDFNVDKNSQIIKWFSSISRNLVSKNGITNTLNPRLHRAKHLFPQGLAADFAFATSGLVVENFKVVVDDLSDHLGLSFDIKI